MAHFLAKKWKLRLIRVGKREERELSVIVCRNELRICPRISAIGLYFLRIVLFRNNIMNKVKIIAEFKHYFCKNWIRWARCNTITPFQCLREKLLRTKTFIQRWTELPLGHLLRIMRAWTTTLNRSEIRNWCSLQCLYTSVESSTNM